MSDLVPAGDMPGSFASPSPPPTRLSPFPGPDGGTLLERLRTFTAQEPVRRMAPWFIGVAALGGAALTWSVLSPSPQRVLYTQLDDGERASVAAALDSAAIAYTIDRSTGALAVDEGDFYRARMLVASDGALAAPQSGTELIDSLPMGASRMLEGERLRAAREHDLMLTIMEIDGVESVRVHLAEGEKSAFVRDQVPPTASVMVRLARGRQLSDSQVTAITNLVAGSVPGLSFEAVRVVDQHGRLLSERNGADSDRLEMQSRMEDKLRRQVAQLLTPMLGEGNFTSEIQVELNMDEVTSARETYDKDGVIRSETQSESQMTGTGPAVGIPGVLANTPPAPAEAEARPPEGTQPGAGQPPVNGESSASRTYELGREVSVANSGPGQLKRLSVAVAISKSAMTGAKAGDLKDIEQLVSAAVGASEQRGDQIKVVSRAFEPVSEEAMAFYETPWFATLVRNGAAVLAVLLVLLLGVRPLIKAFRRDKPEPPAAEVALIGTDDSDDPSVPPAVADERLERAVEAALLSEKVVLAKRLANEKPDSALAALRQMLAEPEPGPDNGPNDVREAA